MNARFGELLRESRVSRGLSQLRLASSARVSTRHLSFLETGRSLPSREMVVQLADVLDLPPRQRNAMLLAAGYAPIYRERALDSPELAAIRRVIARLIESHAPYPALVLDRAYDIVMMSSAAERLRALTAPGRAPATNLLRWLLASDGLRPFITNFDEVASSLVRRLRREARSPAERATLDRIVRESLADASIDIGAPGPVIPAIAVEWRFGDVEVSTISTITTFGTTADVTLDELHIETVIPIDEASDAALRAMLSVDADSVRPR